MLMESIRSENMGYIEVLVDDINKSSYAMNELMKIGNFKVLDARTIRIYETDISEAEITKALVLNDVRIHKIHRKEHSLEEYFMKIINGGTDHA